MASLIDDRKGCFNGFERWIMRLKTRHITPRKTDSRPPFRGLGRSKRKLQGENQGAVGRGQSHQPLSPSVVGTGPVPVRRYEGRRETGDGRREKQAQS